MVATGDEMIDLRLGDCLVEMATLPDASVDAVICDPPYPNLKGGLTHMIGGVSAFTRPSVTVGTPWGSDLSALAECRRVARYGAIVFCSFHSVGLVRQMLGGEAVGLVTWYQRNAQPSFRNRPHYMCEYIWLIEYAPGMNWKPLKTMYDIPRLPAGCFATERIVEPGTKKAAHPAQKPVQLMKALVQAAPESVLDPYMGTATTGVACIETGRSFIGIENDPEYFRIGSERCEKAAAALQQLEIAV
jgi:DNA modification methylase